MPKATSSSSKSSSRKDTRRTKPKPKPKPDHGPRTDAFISIHTKHVDNILARVKNHEFRSYRLATVQRFWLYQTSPVQSVRYVMTVGPAKSPGEITNPGLRNDAFNSGETGKHRFAYPVLKIEELEKPLGLKVLASNGWMGTPPQAYTYLNVAMRGAERGMKRVVVFDATKDGEDVQDEDSKLSELEDEEEAVVLPSSELSELPEDGHDGGGGGHSASSRSNRATVQRAHMHAHTNGTRQTSLLEYTTRR